MHIFLVSLKNQNCNQETISINNKHAQRKRDRLFVPIPSDNVAENERIKL